MILVNKWEGCSLNEIGKTEIYVLCFPNFFQEKYFIG